MNRRNLLKGLSLLPLTAGFAKPFTTVAAPTTKRDLYKELGVTPVINAGVTMTFLSGSLMMPEVLDAINSTSHDFANMFELQDKVGKNCRDAPLRSCDGHFRRSLCHGIGNGSCHYGY